MSEDIDKTLKLGTNVPMGPLTLAASGLKYPALVLSAESRAETSEDFIGLDTCLSIMQECGCARG